MVQDNKLQPNTTPIPNFLLDEAMSLISDKALRVLMIIARQTYGWHKDQDWISYALLIQKTGLHKESISLAIKELRDKDLIVIADEDGNELWDTKLCGKRKLFYRIKVGKTDLLGDEKRSENPTFKGRKIRPFTPITPNMNNNIYITKETLTKEIHASSSKERKFSEIKDLTENDLQDISDRYRVPVSFVKSKLEDMENWHAMKPHKNHYANYKRALMDWVKKDAIKLVERSRGDLTKRGIDARNL